MRCCAKTRLGLPCEKEALLNKRRCRLHGGLSLAGADHWNYQNGLSTKKARQKRSEVNAALRLLEQLAVSTGLIL